MNKKSAMSAMGYAIISIIILGVGMIISAPMLVNNVKEDKSQSDFKSFEREEISNDNAEVRELENRLTARIDDMERRQANPQRDSLRDKYVCTIEGNLDENGNIVPTDSPYKTEKFVFVCEYRR